MKQKKKGKITLSFASPEKEFFYIYLWCDYMGKIKKKLCWSLLLEPQNEFTFLSPISHFFFLPDAMGFLALVAFFFGLFALP
jgi:hypothetical protein